MKLNVTERLTLLATLPQEQSYIHLKLLRKLKEELSIDNEETKKLNMKWDGPEVTWDGSVNIEKEIEVGEVEEALIKRELKRLDDNQKLTINHMSLYEKFVEEE